MSTPTPAAGDTPAPDTAAAPEPTPVIETAPPDTAAPTAPAPAAPPAPTPTPPAPAPEPAADPEPAQEADGDDDAEGEPFDRGRAMAKIRKANSEARGLRKQVDDLKAQLQSRVDPTEAQAAIALVEASAARDVARLRVGHRYGLPEQLVDLLQGDTAEEIEAHAKTLAPLVTGSGAALGSGGLDPTQAPVETDPRKLAAKIPRRH